MCFITDTHIFSQYYLFYIGICFKQENLLLVFCGLQGINQSNILKFHYFLMLISTNICFNDAAI